MVCIYCSRKTKITNSRPQKRLNQKWRRHTCTECLAVFTTVEAFDPETSLLIQHGKRQLPFQRELLFVSIYESLRHRPQAAKEAKALTDTILAHLLPLATSATLTRENIVTTTAKTLKNFDKAAHTHYLAYHPL
jgi:transcriptional regulator NrdR family protein